MSHFDKWGREELLVTWGQVLLRQGDALTFSRRCLAVIHPIKGCRMKVPPLQNAKCFKFAPKLSVECLQVDVIVETVLNKFKRGNFVGWRKVLSHADRMVRSGALRGASAQRGLDEQKYCRGDQSAECCYDTLVTIWRCVCAIAMFCSRLNAALTGKQNKSSDIFLISLLLIRWEPPLWSHDEPLKVLQYCHDEDNNEWGPRGSQHAWCITFCSAISTRTIYFWCNLPNMSRGKIIMHKVTS